MTRPGLFGAAAATIAVVLSACSDLGTRPPRPVPTLQISDGAHSGGNVHFYFLPPMVPQPAWSGTFDAALSPVVRVTQGAALVASLSADVDAAAETYQANWHTGEFALDPSQTYRITVFVGKQELGFADVDVVASGREMRNVNTGEYVALLDDRTLPIKFRIEAGALPSDLDGYILYHTGPYGGGAGAYNIYRMGPDGSGIVSLVADGYDNRVGNISPDGRKVVFVSNRSGRYALHTMDIDGSRVSAPLLPLQSCCGEPKWSPDGTHIVFSDGDYVTAAEIFVLDLASSTVSQVTHAGHAEQATWSPDGERLAYAVLSGGGWQLFVSAADGSNATPLVTGPGWSPFWADSRPSWCSSGRIAFQSRRSGYLAIYTVNADGSDVRQVTAPASENFDQAICSPSGEWLAFRAHDRADIYRIRSDGSSELLLLDGTDHTGVTAWGRRPLP